MLKHTRAIYISLFGEGGELENFNMLPRTIMFTNSGEKKVLLLENHMRDS